ncbi:MAG TPA: enoyl-CoA hydratase-related protein [Macromonas sp.]|nr:enoyl-CoA hydratase-related protein [Macromonas sp.]
MTRITQYHVQDRVATLTLNRPEARNALSPEVVSELIDLIRQADADAAVKCILIQGTGEHFSGGGDIKHYHELLSLSPEERYDVFERKVLVSNRLPNAILTAQKPVVIAARGAVAGGGLALCLAADFVLCGESAFFLAAHVRIGLPLDCGLSGLLPAAMGIKAAKRIALLGDRIPAQEALALGMVTQVVPDEQLPEVTAKLLKRLTAGPSTAMALTKAQINLSVLADMDTIFAAEVTGVARCAASDDFKRGIESAVSGQPHPFA